MPQSIALIELDGPVILGLFAQQRIGEERITNKIVHMFDVHRFFDVKYDAVVAIKDAYIAQHAKVLNELGHIGSDHGHRIEKHRPMQRNPREC